ERPRHVIIIRTKPGQQVPCGMRKSFIDGVALTTVRLAYPVFQMLLIFLDDIETIVRAPAVDHDILDIRILLIEDREYGLFKIRTLVVRGGDDRNLWVGVNHNRWLLYSNLCRTHIQAASRLPVLLHWRQPW